MDKETQQFKENIDAWVKQIRSEVSEYEELSQIVYDDVDNIQHNYELIYDLKDEIENLKAELAAIKLVQIISLKLQKCEVIADEKL
jgi:archaellum component FlaC